MSHSAVTVSTSMVHMEQNSRRLYWTSSSLRVSRSQQPQKMQKRLVANALG